MATSLTCRIEQHGKYWTAKGIATYANHENYHHDPWETPPFEKRKNEPAANKDCLKWFDAVRKIQAATKPVDVNELLKKEKK